MLPESLDTRESHLVIHIITAARIPCAWKWKKTEIPNREELVEKIMEVVEMNILTEALKDNSIQEASEKWDPIYNWICSIT